MDDGYTVVRRDCFGGIEHDHGSSVTPPPDVEVEPPDSVIPVLLVDVSPPPVADRPAPTLTSSPQGGAARIQGAGLKSDSTYLPPAAHLAVKRRTSRARVAAGV